MFMKNNYGIGKFLICMVIIVVIFTLGNFYIQQKKIKKENQVMPWDSGKITIIDKEIQLPCSLEEFKNITGIEILENNGEYRHEKIKTLYFHTTLLYDAIVENNYVIGINLPIYDSDEKESVAYKLDAQSNDFVENEFWVARNVIFPEGLTSSSTTEEILNKYGKKNDIKDKISDDIVSHTFIGKDFLIEFWITDEEEISEVAYYKIEK